MTKGGLILRYVYMLLLFSLISCGGGESSKSNGTAPKPASQEVAKDENQSNANGMDTIWQETVRMTYHTKSSDLLDTTIVIDGERFNFRYASSFINEDYIFVDYQEKKGKIHATKMIGKNRSYVFELRNAKKKVVASRHMDKNSVDDFSDGYFLAMGDCNDWRFLGYNEHFECFVFSVVNRGNESDFGQNVIVFLDRSLKLKYTFPNMGLGGSECDCDWNQSSHAKTYTFCSRIINADGSFVNLQSKDRDVAGSFQLNDTYSLVIYTYQGKPPFNNARIIKYNGEVAKTFDFEGITGDMGYTIPQFRVKDQDALFLVDAAQECIVRFDVQDPLKYQRTPFESLAVLEDLNDQKRARKITTYSELPTPDFYYLEGVLYR